MRKKVWLMILLGALLPALAYPHMVFAKSGRETIQSTLAASRAAQGYEVEIDRFKSRLDRKAPMHDLRLLPKAAIRSQGQDKKSLRLKVQRDARGRVQYHRLAPPQTPQPASGLKSQAPQATVPEAPQEAIFTVDPQDLFHNIDQATITELSRSPTELVLKIEMPPSAAPAHDWPEMWLQATFDPHRDLLLKSELMVEGEARIISEFNYRLVENRHWLPDQKNIRIVEKDKVTLIDDTYGTYRLQQP